MLKREHRNETAIHAIDGTIGTSLTNGREDGVQHDGELA